MTQPKRAPRTPHLVALSGANEPSPATASGSLVVECLQAEHPTLTGRVKVRWHEGDQRHERWLPTLRGMVVREDDYLLVARPDHWTEPIATGVIDGFARRLVPPNQPVAAVTVRAGESVSVRTADGQPLFELTEGQGGPEIHFAQPDVELCVDGSLRIGAKVITLSASEGEARIEASDDVILKGENIHLN